MTNYFKIVVIAGSRKYYRRRPYIYWYFDSKAKTRRFNIGIRLILVYFLKCTLKSILDGYRRGVTPNPFQNP